MFLNAGDVLAIPFYIRKEGQREENEKLSFQELYMIQGRIPHFSPARAARCCSLGRAPPEWSWKELSVHPKFSVCFLVHIRERLFIPEPSLFLAKGSDFTRSGMNSAFRLLLTTPETLIVIKYSRSTKSHRCWVSNCPSLHPKVFSWMSDGDSALISF